MIGHASRPTPSHGGGGRARGLLGATGLLLAALLLAACGAGGFQADDVRVNAADASEPGLNQLIIPDLLEPTIAYGVYRFDLSLGEAEHEFGLGAATSTISYNDESILGPTLRWTSGSSVELHVANDLDEGTSAEQIFLGAAGMIIVDDDNPAAANLPTTYGVDEIPVILQDREFDDDMQSWQSRPLDTIYPVLMVDGIRIKIRDGTVTNRTVYVVMGINGNSASSRRRTRHPRLVGRPDRR